VSVLKVLAGLLATNPPALRHLLASEGLSEAIMGEIRKCVTISLLETRESIRYETSWNKFLAKKLADDVIIRYFLVSIIFRCCLVCRSADDCYLQFAEFVVQVTRALLNNPDPGRYTHLTWDEVLESAESLRPTVK
jgi:hypothetical protein